MSFLEENKLIFKKKKKMKRRDPTRIELKLDDIQEYEQMKRELEKNKAADESNTEMQESNSGNGPDSNGAGIQSRAETIHRRIGYDPAPKMS